MKILGESPAERRRAAVLLGILAVAGAGAWYWGYGPTGTPAAESNTAKAVTGPTPGASGKAGSGVVELPTALNFAALEPVPAPGDSTRNPFRFYVPPPPPPPPPPKGPTPEQMRQQQQDIAERQRAAAVPTGPPPITLKYFGLAGGVALLSDGHNVLYGREGAILDGRYRIVKIGLESIQIEYVDGRGRTTIPLKGG
jgi:hypothetical protein